MQKFLLLLISIIIFLSPCQASADKILFASECLKIDEGCQVANLMAYTFDQSGLSQSTEYERFADYNDYIFSPWPHENIIVRNRYIVSGTSVYDTKLKKIVHQGTLYSHIKHYHEGTVYYHGDLIAVNNKRVFYWTFEPDKQNMDDGGVYGTYVFDLEKQKYSKLAGAGILLFYHDLIFFYDKRESAFSVSKYIKYLLFPPVKDGWYDLGHGFKAEIRYTDSDKNPINRKISYQGKVIGEFWFSNEVKTTDGAIAIEYGPLGSNLGYPEGLAVWTEESQTWTKIEFNFLQAFIGWVDVNRPKK